MALRHSRWRILPIHKLGSKQLSELACKQQSIQRTSSNKVIITTKKMKVAIYARVSTQDQTTDNQTLPLVQYCQRMGYEYVIFVEKESTRNFRTVQQELYTRLLHKEFDGLIIYKFDRWARSTRELVDHMETLYDKGVMIYSYSENIDLSSSMGRAMLTIISAFAQLERDLIRERTLAGLARARAWGKKLGRPRKTPLVKHTPNHVVNGEG